MSDEKKTTIEAGNHKVKVDKWGLRETGNGNVQAWIRFSNGATMFQNVNSNDTGDEILARALTVCGFRGKDLGDLYKANALDVNKTIEIYVQHQMDNQGKLRLQVNVSDPARAMKGNLDKAEGLKIIKNLKINLRSDLKNAQSDRALMTSSAEPTKEQEQEIENEDENIPF